MNFWQEIYDAAKDRRYGMLFFGTFLVMLFLLLIGLGICGMTGVNSLDDCVYPLLIGMGVFVLVTTWRLVRHVRRRRRERMKSEQLSCDELAKARSKLRSGFRPPMKKLPDIDLKY